MIWFKISILLFIFYVNEGVNCEKVDSDVQNDAKQNKTQNVIVHCPKSQSPESSQLVDNILKQIKEKSQNPATTRTDIITELTQQLKYTIFKFLEPVITLLKKLGVRFEVLWISFEICIFDANGDTIDQLVAIGIVSRIRQDPVIPRIPPQPPGSQPPPQGNKTYNIGLIDARCIGITCYGKNVTIGFIDTGALASHEEIKDNWVGRNKDTPFGYLDPANQNCTPSDSFGDGTHVVSIAVGKTVGVAPEAKWMMCTSCSSTNCSESSLKICALWLACPYKCDDKTLDKATQNCTLRPNAINSNGRFSLLDLNRVPYYLFYEYVEYWNLLGIISIFPSGNTGPGCSKIGYPAGYDIVIDVGATDEFSRLLDLSSNGPVLSTKPLTNSSIAVGYCSPKSCGNNNKTCVLIKPTIVAPGYYIRGAGIRNNTDFAYLSGTDIATPHVSGVVALMICVNPNIKWNYTLAYEILTTTTDTSRIDVLGERQSKNIGTLYQSNLRCNMMMSNICNTYPNNLYGYGMVNACKAVAASKNKKM